ncbi:MAG: hypothetical protein HY923_01725 [Elusimicrobia bacterium]|nr:hypothetical protein [Elusimicrobiota bacterium]
MALFSKSLERLRLESGFTTPYAFYHRNGGRHVFPFTFAYYLKLERGQHLPRPEWLPILLSLLRIPPSDELYRRFITDYLRDHFGTEANFQSLLGPLLISKHEKKYGQQATKRLLTEQSYHITPKQFQAIVSDAPTYWAFECLVNDRGSFDAAELSQVTGLPKSSLEAGLKKLVAQKLARRVTKGKYKSPLAGKYYVFPKDFPDIEHYYVKLRRYQSEMVARSGAVVHQSGVMIRAEEGAVRRSITAMRDALEAATAYSVYEKAEGSGIFILQIRTRKAFDF